MITVITCDDHGIVMAGIERVLDSTTDMSLLASVGNERDLMREVARCQPDVVLLDIGLDGTSGLDLIERLHRECPRIKIIMFSMHGSQAYVRRARSLGAQGYLTKDCLDEELTAAIRAVVSGHDFVGNTEQIPTAPPHAGAQIELLSQRELEVLTLLAEGLTNGEIAEALLISSRTVETHRARIQTKLQVRTRAELTRVLMEQNTPGSGNVRQGAP